MAIKVIGAGFGRTGTDSMREALNLLGLGPCHHMFEVNRDEAQRTGWRLAYIKRVEDRKSLVVTLIAEQVFGGRPDDKAHAISLYEAHVREVLDTVPAGRLLVHRLGDGWPSLCAHLGVATPEAAYPQRNSTSEIKSALSIN